MVKTHFSGPPAPATMGRWDTVSLIVGIIVGVGIFQAPGAVFQSVSGPWSALGVWALGGVLSLAGALCFAELASTYPRSGGEYVYLNRAYGPSVGFLFAWAQLAVIRTGAGIAALAYIVANQARQICDLGEAGLVLTAVLAIALLTLINIFGAIPGKRTQNWLTVAKLLGLAALVSPGSLSPVRDPRTRAQLRPRGPSGWQCCSFFTRTTAGTRPLTSQAKYTTGGVPCPWP